MPFSVPVSGDNSKCFRMTKCPWGGSRLKLRSVKDHCWVRARTGPGNDPGFYCNCSGASLEASKQRGCNAIYISKGALWPVGPKSDSSGDSGWFRKMVRAQTEAWASGLGREPQLHACPWVSHHGIKMTFLCCPASVRHQRRRC